MEPAAEYDARYLAGIAAFNRGDVFAAHEVWEHLWRDCPAAERRFYHSLIQAAVAIYHWGRHNRIGSARLFAAGREKAEAYRPFHLGLDVARFWQDVEACLAAEPGAIALPQIDLSGVRRSEL